MTQRPPVAIVHGVPNDMRQQAVALYEDAFGAKFAVAIPDPARRSLLLSEAVDLSFAFAAINDGRLVGVAGYKTEAGSFTSGISFRLLIRQLGLVRAIRAASIFSLYERSSKPGELLLDGIVVEASARGSGVGTILLQTLVKFARASGYRSVRLDVVDTNPDARRMYERNHFVATRTERYEYLRWLLGFGASTTLVRQTTGA